MMLQVAERGALRLTLVETESDAKALQAAGVRSVLTVAGLEDVVMAAGKENERLRPQFAAYSEFVLAMRRGNEQLRDDLALRLGDTRCRWLRWPEGYGTAEALEREEGVNALRAVVANARAMWSDEVSRLSDIPEPQVQTSYTTGIKGLDEYGFRITRPCFWPTIGPYGSGKSILARQLIANFWKLHGWRTLLTSFEEKVKPRMQRDFRRHFCTHPHRIMTDADDLAADRVIEEALLFLRRPRCEELDAERLFDRIEYAVHVHKIDVVCIDPVNEIDHRVPRGESKSDYMGRFMMRLKQLADDYNLVVMVLAHPPKDGVALRNSPTKIYTLNDGADTAHYGNKADIGWTVWRPMKSFDKDGPPPPTFLNIDKTKDHEVMGKPVIASLILQDNGQFRVDQIGNDALRTLTGE